ncbi:hypothetical protein MMC10_000805 [Thelotrema lepadinum]|nr:hypothetical protein [Thelotrema lepadinum]
MDSIKREVKKFINDEDADASTRHEVSTELRALAASIENPREAVERHAYSCTYSAVNQVAVDLGLFKILSGGQGWMTDYEVASKCGADSILTSRLLRLLAAIHTIDKKGEYQFTGNETTKALATPEGASAITHGFYFLNKCFQELPKFLKDRNYQSPNNALDTTFQQAFDTKQHAFSWVQTQPNILGNFLASMPVQQGTNSWTSAIPLVKRLESADPSAVQFVDIGGGLGSQCVAFINATKGSLPGKVILQDLPETLGLAHNHEGMEKMAQNYFEGQDIKGATFYYLRNVLHEYPNEKCLQILNHQISAMGKQSTMLIDELVLPNASLRAAQTNIIMMATLASFERTEAQWRDLLRDAGLKALGIHLYDLEMGWGIIEAAPK